MLRFVVTLLVSIVLITFLRVVIGLITRTMGDMLGPPRPKATPSQTPAGGGELKRDPVCGTYVAAATAVKKTVKGEVVHFCSEECKGKYEG